MRSKDNGHGITIEDSTDVRAGYGSERGAIDKGLAAPVAFKIAVTALSLTTSQRT
jgi:hypothetical protein